MGYIFSQFWCQFSALNSSIFYLLSFSFRFGLLISFNSFTDFLSIWYMTLSLLRHICCQPPLQKKQQYFKNDTKYRTEEHLFTISFSKWSQWLTAGGISSSLLVFLGNGGPTIFSSFFSTVSLWARSALTSTKSALRLEVLLPRGDAGAFYKHNIMRKSEYDGQCAYWTVLQSAHIPFSFCPLSLWYCQPWWLHTILQI